MTKGLFLMLSLWSIYYWPAYT